MNLIDLLFPKNCLECKRDGKYICDICISKVPTGGRRGDDVSVFKYQGVIRKAIISLKYKFATDIADELTNIISQRLPELYMLHDKVLVSIPLHKQRENLRGFNQAELIGKKLAEQMGWEFAPDLLIKNKNTMPQVGLKGLARHSNLSGVFAVSPSNIENTKRNILIFDDVYTTGSTIKEAKKTLESTGFKDILSLTIAR